MKLNLLPSHKQNIFLEVSTTESLQIAFSVPVISTKYEKGLWPYNHKVGGWLDLISFYELYVDTIFHG